MLNQPAERTQIDGQGDEYSELTGIDTGQDSLTRQEFKADADINTILSRFGLMNIPTAQGAFGEYDFDIDLQQGLSLVQRAVRAHSRLTAALQEKYPTWQDLLYALHNSPDQLKEDLKPTTPEPTPAPIT